MKNFKESTQKIKRFKVANYMNLNTFEAEYGAMAVYGRKKSERARFPLIFKDEAVAKKMCEALAPLIGTSMAEIESSETANEVYKQFLKFACNMGRIA